MFIDIHTHHQSIKEENRLSIYNLNVPDYLCRCGLDLKNTFYSLGIHPWTIKEDLLSENLRYIEENASFNSIKAIGECGLDKLCETDWKIQERAFIAHIKISESIQKPLIIHCVKAFDEIISFREEIKPCQPWIIHGFRGKPEQGLQLIGTGFHLSFSPKYNPETVRTIPLDRIFLETDNNQCSIESVYKMISDSLNIDTNILQSEIKKNVALCFKM